MQFQLKHLLIATTIIAATLAISPALTIFLFFLLALFLLVNLIVPQRRFHKDADLQKHACHQIFSPTIGLAVCTVLFLFSIGLPIIQEFVYLSTDWYLQLWLAPQFLCYIASLLLLSFVRFDSHDRYEFRVIVTIYYIVFIPVTLLGVFIWHILSTETLILGN